MLTKTEILERERRGTMIAGIAAVAGVALILASFGDSAAGVRAGVGLADRLAEVDGERGKLVVASVVQLIGWMLLAVPLVFMFRAAAARSDRVRSGLVGLIIVAPLFIGIGGLVSAGSILQAATDFKDVPTATISKCVEEKAAEESKGDESKQGDGGSAEAPSATELEQLEEDCADETARDVRGEVSLAPLETGLGLAGLIGFTISVVYVSLWSMRTGLLSRFWGSLGLALGAVFVFFTLFTLIWFIYLGLLLAGWVPGGRPPAWAAGEAVEPPRPSGGLFGPRPGQAGSGDADERATDEWGEPVDGAIEGSGEELAPREAPEPRTAGEEAGGTGKPGGSAGGTGESGEAAGDEPPRGERRKRKKRNG